MQTHIPATTTRSRIGGLRRWPTLAGLSLALALAVAIGVARITGHDSTRTEGTTAAPEAGLDRPAQSAALTEAPAPILYIAATQAQAAFVLERSAEVNALRALLGQPQVSVGAVVLEAGRMPALDGLPAAPGLRVIDLRMP
jgi:hypothetical protein